MVAIKECPDNPGKIEITLLVQMYLEKTALQCLSDEVGLQIRAQAKKDIKHSKLLQRVIADAASKMLLRMLGESEPRPVESTPVAVIKGKPELGTMRAVYREAPPVVPKAVELGEYYADDFKKTLSKAIGEKK